MRISTFLLISGLVAFGINDAEAQTRSHSFIHNGNLYSYSIQRYTPVWMVQTGQQMEERPVAKDTRFFRDIRENQVEPLKGLLFNASGPKTTARNASGMNDYLAQNSISMYYLVRVGNNNVYMAHLNGSPNRSIIPFKEESGKWTLDVDFAETQLFNLLKDLTFDPFGGRFSGIRHLAIGFEGVENNMLVDHSGRQQRSRLNNAAFAAGAVGRAMRINNASSAVIEVKAMNGLNSENLFLNVQLNLDWKQAGTVLKGTSDKGAVTVELTASNLKGKLNVAVAGAEPVLIDVPVGQWFGLDVKVQDGELTVSVSDAMVSSSKMSKAASASVMNVQLGGNSSASGLIDELNIGY
jgi:hypothetical protein